MASSPEAFPLVPPEQAPGAEEVQPEGIAPAAGYPSLDPRSEDKPYKDA